MKFEKHPLKRLKQIMLCTMLCVYSLTGAGCGVSDPKTEPIKSAYFDVVEYAIDKESPDSVYISEDQVAACFTDYTKEYEEASRRYTQDIDLATEQAGPSDADGNPIYPKSRLHLYNFEGNLLKDIDLDTELAPTEDRRILAENPAGGFCVYSVYTDFHSFEVTYQLAFFKSDGEHTKDILLLPGEYIQAVQSICISDNGKIYIEGFGVDYADKVLVFSGNGRLEQAIEMEPVTSPSLLSIHGGIYLHASVFRDNQNREALFKVDTGSAEIGEPAMIPEGYPVESSVFASGNACCSYDQQKLCEYSLETRSVREIVKWSDTDMSVTVMAARVLPGQKIVCVGMSKATGMTTFSVLTGTDKNPLLSKKEIVVAGLGVKDDWAVQKLVYRFNSTHKDYRITLRDYQDEVDQAQSSEQKFAETRRILLMDYFAGNSPDLYLDIDGNLSLIDYSSKEYLINMAPFIDESEQINEENYYMDVLLAAQRNEFLFYLPTCFSVNCFSGFPETIQGRKSWTIKDFNNMAAALPEGTKVQSWLSKDNLLFWGLQSSISSYVNFDSLEADFSGENFINLLEWANQYGIEDTSQIGSNINDPLKFEYIDSVDSVMIAYSYYNKSLEYIGFPGGNASGICFYPRYLMAISSQTTEADVCWELISDALSEEYQKTSVVYANPVNRNAVQYQIDEDRKESEDIGLDSYTDEEWTNGSLIYEDILERADEMLSRSDSIYAIVSEESAAYFAGQKTAPEVAALIQNRVQNFLNERG